MKKKTKKVYNKIALVLLGVLLQSLNSYIYDDYMASKQQVHDVKEEKIALIDKQLLEFYIPLKIKLDKSRRLFINYKKKYANDKVFSQIIKSKNREDMLRWQRYVLSAFLPIHTELDRIISSKRYLMDKNVKISDQLDLLEQHIVYYKVIFMKWQDNDVSENFAPTQFPRNLASLISLEIERLKIEKIKLEAE